MGGGGFLRIFFFALDISIGYDILSHMSKTPDRQERDAHKAFAAIARDLWPVAKGSLARVARPCGRPKTCRACLSGKRHPMWIFTFRREGQQHCRYVPAELVEPLRRALANGRELEKRLAEEGMALIERYRRERASRPGGE